MIRKSFYLVIDIVFCKLKKIKIFSTEETLIKLKNEKVSISRFGDGEFNLILGKGIPFQKYDKKLSFQLREILKINQKQNNHIVAIPYIFTNDTSNYTLDSIKFWKQYLLRKRRKIYANLNLQYYYYDSQVTRIYINRKNKSNSKKYFELWKKIWENRRIIIVEGEYSRLGVGNDLMDNVLEIKRIICPAKNAYTVYRDIIDSILEIYNKDDLVLLLLGPTATILSYELTKFGIQAIDIGNLDMEYEWMKKKVDKQIKIKGKYTHETNEGEDNYELVDSSKYEEQIVKRIIIKKKL